MIHENREIYLHNIYGIFIFGCLLEYSWNNNSSLLRLRLDPEYLLQVQWYLIVAVTPN